jgi:hypothetical protein
MKYVESKGYRDFRTMIMPGMAVYKKFDIPDHAGIRNASEADLPQIAELLKRTWQNYELWEPCDARTLADYIRRVPEYDYENLFVLEQGGAIKACLGYWNWGRVMHITVVRLSVKLKIVGLVLDALRLFRPMPKSIKPGFVLKQIMLTPVGFDNAESLVPLVRYVNNLALEKNIGLIYCVCDPGHTLLASLKDFIRVDTNMHIYIKELKQDLKLKHAPIYMDGIDM